MGLIWALLALILWAGVVCAHPTQRRPFSGEELESLLQSLQNEGLERVHIEGIFNDSRLHKLDEIVGMNAFNDESHRMYKQFLTPYAINKARRFRIRHFPELWAIERRFGVSLNILVAVLLVETQLGTAKLPYRVMEVFSTLAIGSSPGAVERQYQRIKLNHPDIERDYLETRLEQKATWALQELVALLTLGIETGVDPLEIKGSFAGAFGMPQFLPTSYRRWAVDGNRDQRVDLDNRSDAVASIANYLRAHGWRNNTGLKQKMRSVWKYNNSPPYVDAIFAISRKLSLPSRKRPAVTRRESRARSTPRPLSMGVVIPP